MESSSSLPTVSLTLDGVPALASGHHDGGVHVMRYDEQTRAWQQSQEVGIGTESAVTSLCVLTLDGVAALASGHFDGAVRISRYQDGIWQAAEASIVSSGSPVSSLCVLTVDGVPALASGYTLTAVCG